MLATAGRVTGDPSSWAAEVKWDGWRALVSVDSTVKARTRRGRDVTASLPEPAPLADSLAGRCAILDGENVICDGGTVDCYQLAGRMAATGRTAIRAATATPVTFVIFDLLHLDGVDMTGRPLLERNVALDGLGLAGPSWAVNRWYPGNIDSLFAVCVEQGREGVVAKRLDSIYRPGVRSRTWVKTKNPDCLQYDAPRGPGHGRSKPLRPQLPTEPVAVGATGQPPSADPRCVYCRELSAPPAPPESSETANRRLTHSKPSRHWLDEAFLIARSFCRYLGGDVSWQRSPLRPTTLTPGTHTVAFLMMTEQVGFQGPR